MGGEVFRTYPDRPWGPPSLLYNGYRVFPVGKGGRGVTLTTHPHLVPRSCKSTAIPLLPLWARVACYRVKPYLTLLPLDTSTAGPPNPNRTMRPRQHALLAIRSTVLREKLAATLPRNSLYLWKPGTLPLISVRSQVTPVKALPSYFF